MDAAHSRQIYSSSPAYLESPPLYTTTQLLYPILQHDERAISQHTLFIHTKVVHSFSVQVPGYTRYSCTKVVRRYHRTYRSTRVSIYRTPRARCNVQGHRQQFQHYRHYSCKTRPSSQVGRMLHTHFGKDGRTLRGLSLREDCSLCALVTARPADPL